MAENKNIQGVLTLLGFAQKGKMLVAGDANVDAYLKKDKVVLLIMASDLAKNRKNEWRLRAANAGIELIEISDKLQLGIAVGMSPRTIIGVIDQQMAQAIVKKLQA